MQELELWKARATAAEAKLEAIRQGVENLPRHHPAYYSMDKDRHGEWLDRDDVLALLQPQPQADESGLPG